jgi:hypothetical protein
LVALVAIVGAMALGLSPDPALAAVCPNAEQRAQNNSTGLADCRAYEMVSPAFKGGFDAAVRGFDDLGSVASFSSTGGFADRTQTQSVNIYQARRGDSGWLSESHVPAASALLAPSGIAPLNPDNTPDQATELWTLRTPSQSAYTQDYYISKRGGPFVKVGATQLPSPPQGDNPTYRGGSADLSHLVFQTADSLLPADTRTSGQGLYEYAAAGSGAPELRLVGVDDAGHLISSCGTGLGSADTSQARNALSRDGRTIIFTAQACPADGGPDVNRIYARIDGAHTVAISGATADAQYEGAANDGSAVFFTTAEQLVGDDTDSGRDLYRYDLEASQLTRISAPAAAASADVEGVESISNDGSHVYFVAQGVLAPNIGARGSTAAAGAHNLYVWDRDAAAGGETKFIAQLPPEDGPFWSTSQVAHQNYPTPDNATLLFATYGQLTPDDTDASVDLYSYAVADGALQRISVAADDAAPGAGNGAFDATLTSRGAGMYQDPFADPNVGTGRPMSDDGAYMFFQTDEPLASGDVNAMTDVYGFHDGHVSLISNGQSELGPVDTGTTEGALLAGTTPSGRDVFFVTRSALVPGDSDGGNTDLYDARIDGGFTVEAKPSCSIPDGNCQPLPLPSPFVPVAGSGPIPGQGTVSSPPPVFSVATVTARQRNTLSKTGKVTLRVGASEAGLLAVKATALLHKKTTTVASAAKQVTGAGTASLPLTLSKKARTELASSGRLTVKVAVSYSKTSTIYEATLRLAHAKPKAKAKKKAKPKRHVSAKHKTSARKSSKRGARAPATAINGDKS